VTSIKTIIISHHGLEEFITQKICHFYWISLHDFVLIASKVSIVVESSNIFLIYFLIPAISVSCFAVFCYCLLFCFCFCFFCFIVFLPVDTSVATTKKTDSNDISEISLKVTINADSAIPTNLSCRGRFP